ncbi:MAG: PilZ domain-containing protein [Rhodoblastus sp.]
MEESRKSERVRSLYRAQIMFGSIAAVECLVKNFSSTGVRLEIADGTPLPKEFKLNIPHKGRIYDARIVWRAEGIVGAEFIDPHTEPAGSEGDARSTADEPEGDRIDRLLQENARLRQQIHLLKLRVAELSGEA